MTVTFSHDITLWILVGSENFFSYNIGFPSHIHTYIIQICSAEKKNAKDLMIFAAWSHPVKEAWGHKISCTGVNSKVVDFVNLVYILRHFNHNNDAGNPGW